MGLTISRATLRRLDGSPDSGAPPRDSNAAPAPPLAEPPPSLQQRFQKNMELAAYLTARSMLHKTVDDQQAHGLRRANDSVNETRDLLSAGRANVAANLEKSQEPHWRVTFGREQTAQADVLSKTAMAMIMKAGNCAEYAAVALNVHADKLEPDETVTRMTANEISHAWTQTNLRSGDSIAMDAWAYGPAVMAEDAETGSTPANSKAILTLSQSQGKKYAGMVDQCLEEFASDRDLPSEWADYKTDAAYNGAKADKIYPQTPVLGQEFKAAVAQQQAEISQKASAALIPAALETDTAEARPPTDASVPRTSDTLQLMREIKAAGAARAVGANVREAAQLQKDVLGALDALLRPPPEPSASRNPPASWFARLMGRLQSH